MLEREEEVTSAVEEEEREEVFVTTVSKSSFSQPAGIPETKEIKYNESKLIVRSSRTSSFLYLHLLGLSTCVGGREEARTKNQGNRCPPPRPGQRESV